jgi:hypothetical protein
MARCSTTLNTVKITVWPKDLQNSGSCTKRRVVAEADPGLALQVTVVEAQPDDVDERVDQQRDQDEQGGHRNE